MKESGITPEIRQETIVKNIVEIKREYPKVCVNLQTDVR